MTTKKPVKGTPTAPPRKRTSASEAKDGEAAATKRPARPRLQVSHGKVPAAPRKTSAALGKAPAVPRKAPVRAPLPPPPEAVPTRVRAPKKAAPATTGAAQIALAVASAALDKKASNIEIIDLAGKADYTDYLVLMSGGSDRHVRALADYIQEELETKTKLLPLSVEGLGAATWILIDFGDVVVHVFQETTRSVYDIEGLWTDAARIPVSE